MGLESAMSSSQLAISTFPWRESVLEAALDAIAPLGVPAVELYGRLPHLNADPRRASAETLMKAATTRGLRWAAMTTVGGAAFVGEDTVAAEAELARVTATLDLARSLGADVIRVFRVGHDQDRAELADRMAPWYRKAADHAEAVGVRMAVENRGGGISGDPKVCAKVFQAVGSPNFGMLYDPCNYLTMGGDYQDALYALRDHIVHVHLKDGTREPGSEQRTMLGEGELDLRWLVKHLAKIRYGGWITLEYEADNVPPKVGLPGWIDVARRLLG